jgi:hypothetical protein
MNFLQFANEVSLNLALQKPFEIRIKSRNHKWAAGFCEQYMRKDKIVKHVITIYIPQVHSSNFDFYAVIAHEFIHAWQAEYLDNDYQYHGKEFRMKAAKVTGYFWREYELQLNQVYSPVTDIDDKTLD